MEKYINEKTIVKDAIYEALCNSIKCQNCGEIMIKPFICLSCQKRCCQKCMEKIKEGKESCPGKCENPNIAEVTEENNFIKNFQFKCIKGCGKKLKYEEVEFHYNLDCSDKINKPKLLTPQEAAEFKDKTGKEIPHIISN